ncbi:MAG: hypothetical protein WD044_00815 [Dongiaceae bacterium]
MKPPRRIKLKPPAATAKSHLKLFAPITWDGDDSTSCDFIEHLLIELGRLGIKVHEIERHNRAPHTETVLSDLMEWFCEHPKAAYANLVDWQWLDLPRLQARLALDSLAKPRIELSAHITKMNNLSVRWYPKGWRNTEFDWDQTSRHYFNLITHRKWVEPPDFQWFTGDENPTFDTRPSNELMYLRGVGNLRPEPRDSYGPYATYNRDVVDSILICSVRRAYEQLIEQLRRNFDVDVLNAFDFRVREESDSADQWSRRSPIRRVVAWKLEDAFELQERREQDARMQREHRDQEELSDLVNRYGFSAEAFIAALHDASSKKRTSPTPSMEKIDRNAAKLLRMLGSKVNAGDVRRIRQLFECYSPDALPTPVRPPAPSAAPSVESSSNVKEFPLKKD